MKFTNILAFISFSSFGLALEKRLEDYGVFIPEWGVQVTPGGPTVVLNGTVQEVHAELLRLNTNWNDDFGFDAEEITEGGFPEESNIEKRTDFSGSTFYCFEVPPGYDSPAYGFAIQNGIKYLRGVSGNPRNGAGPGNCGRVSCSNNSGIWWCNDDSSPKTLNSFGSIADGAAYLIGKCYDGSYPLWRTSGQVFHKTNWNVIVARASC